MDLLRDRTGSLAVNPSSMIDNDGLNLNGSGPADYYITEGTSMACPFAAGVAALVIEDRPFWTPAQVRARLEQTAAMAATPDNQVGHGLINALAAVSHIRGDFDGDEQVNATDFDILAACATRAAVPYDPPNLPPACSLSADGRAFFRSISIATVTLIKRTLGSGRSNMALRFDDSLPLLADNPLDRCCPRNPSHWVCPPHAALIWAIIWA